MIVLAVAALSAGGGLARAQLPPLLPTTTVPRQEGPIDTVADPEPSTTAPGGPTTATTSGVTLLPPSTTAPAETTVADGGSSTTAPGDASTGETTPGVAPVEPAASDASADPASGGGGDGDGDGSLVGQIVPDDARLAIASIARTAPNDNEPLVAGAAALEAVGVAHDEAMRQVFGAFPILGPARWSDDWHMPRFTGTMFRYHEGLDIVADYGTPVVAPSDGVVRISENPLGGLTVKVVQPDGSYFYLAHLSGTADGLASGQAVTLGQTVGFVGDSGNARGGIAHLHFGVYVRGVATPPKPLVDRWVSEGAARVPELLAAATAGPQPAAIAANNLNRRITDGAIGAGAPSAVPPRSELLWASGANPAGGAVRLAEAAATALGESVDWEQRAAEERVRALAWAQSLDRAWQVLGPLMPPALRQAAESLRIGADPVDLPGI